MAMTVDFFVKPAMLLEDKDNIRGNAGATAVISQKSAKRESFSEVGGSLIISIPALAIR